MKKNILFLSAVFMVICFYCFCYYFSFKNTVNRIEQSKNEYNRNLIPDDSDISGDALQNLQEYTEPVLVHGTEIITSDTVCVFEAFYTDTDEIIRYETGPTADLVGKDREQILDYLSSYMDKIPLSELEEGLISYELLSFSSEMVTLRKTYDRNKEVAKYYITVYKNQIVVYYSDKETVFEYTGIPITEIEEKNRILLIEGIPVMNTEELYDVLAGITS